MAGPELNGPDPAAAPPAPSGRGRRRSGSTPRTFEALVQEAVAHPFRGWDFGWILKGERWIEQPPPWDFPARAMRLARASPDLLDIGTGGGERLLTMAPFPPLTVATESYPPNLRLARRRLAPHGVHVVATWGAPDNVLQEESGPIGRLPFRSGSFHLILDRNEAYVPSEVARVLDHGGRFLTEQTGTTEVKELCRLLDIAPRRVRAPAWTLGFATQQIVRAGLRIVGSGESHFGMRFRDIGALVWYLRAVPWAAPGFSVDRHQDALRRIHEAILRDGPLLIPRYGFWIEATKH